MAVLDKIKNLLPGRKSGPAVSAGLTFDSFNKKSVIVGVLLVVSVSAMVALFSFENLQASKNKAYTRIAAEQQIISQQIAINALEAASSAR